MTLCNIFNVSVALQSESDKAAEREIREGFFVQNWPSFSVLEGDMRRKLSFNQTLTSRSESHF